MILDKSRLTIKKEGARTVYVYNYPSDDKKILITLLVAQVKDSVEYLVDKRVEDLEGNVIVNDDDNRFNTKDLKQAWEKFEDFFEETQKEENPQQTQEEPEIVQVLLSVEVTGQSFLFIAKESGEEELIHEFNLDNFDVSTQNPKYAQLDFSNDSNMPAPFNCEWYMANIDNVIKYSSASNDCTTYLIATKNPNQLGQDGEPKEDGEPKPSDKPSDEGEPKPSDKTKDDGEPKPSDKPSDDGEPKPSDKTTDDGEPKPSDKPSDDGEPKPSDKPSDGANPKDNVISSNESKTNKIDFNEVVQKISEKIGKSPNEVSSALRSAGVFDTFLTLNKVDVKSLMSELNYPPVKSRFEFINQVTSDYQNN